MLKLNKHFYSSTTNEPGGNIGFYLLLYSTCGSEKNNEEKTAQEARIVAKNKRTNRQMPWEKAQAQLNQETCVRGYHLSLEFRLPAAFSVHSGTPLGRDKAPFA